MRAYVGVEGSGAPLGSAPRAVYNLSAKTEKRSAKGRWMQPESDYSCDGLCKEPIPIAACQIPWLLVLVESWLQD